MSMATPSRSSSASTIRAWISESQPGTCPARVARVIFGTRRAPVSAATVSAIRPSSDDASMSRPRHARQNPRRVDRVAAPPDELDHRGEPVVAQIMRFEAELPQPVMGRAIVMLLLLAARIVEHADRDVETKPRADAAHALGQFQDGENLRELVKHAQPARRGRRVDRQAQALQRVAQIEIAAPLMPLAIHGQRNAARGLRREAVDHGPEQVVVMEMRKQGFVVPRLVAAMAIDWPLHQIGGAQAAAPRLEFEKIGVEDLAGVIEAAA